MKILDRGKNFVVLSLKRKWRNGYTAVAFVRVDFDEHGRVTRCTLVDPFPDYNCAPGEGVAISMLVDDLATQVRAAFTILKYLGTGMRSWSETEIEWFERYANPRAPLTRQVEMCWDPEVSRYRFSQTKEAICAAVL